MASYDGDSATGDEVDDNGDGATGYDDDGNDDGVIFGKMWRSAT